MRRRRIALGLFVAAAAIFAFFVPVIYVPPPPNCVFGCPPVAPLRSITYVLIGHGAVYGGTFPYGTYMIEW